MTVTLPLPFRASRFLGPGNALLGVPGVALDLVGIEAQQAILEGWRRRVVRVAAHLGWPRPRTATFRAGDRRVLTFTAPVHQLQTARAANEWALCACVARRDPYHWGALREAFQIARADVGATSPMIGAVIEAGIDKPAALARLRELARVEAESFARA